MQQARSSAHAVAGITAVEIRKLERFTGSQNVCKIEWIETPCHADLHDRILLHRDLPGAAPAERAEPDVSMILIFRVAALNCEPWIAFVACRSTAALEDNLAGMQ